jgi:glycerol-3-phosphate cytidylyltransferase
MKPYRKAIGFGSMNPLHYGHILLFLHAAVLADTVVAGLNSDEYITETKGKVLFQGYPERHRILSQIRCVDLIVPQSAVQDKEYWIRELGCDLIFSGDDNRDSSCNGEEAAWKCGIDFLYLPHTPEIHSAGIRNLIGKEPAG